MRTMNPSHHRRLKTHLFCHVAATFMATLLLAAPALAQNLRIGGTRLNKHDALIDALPAVVEKGLRSTVAFHPSDSNRVSVLGTVVDEAGFVLTKASEVSGIDGLVCSLPNGDQVGASVVWENEEYDIALIKVESTGLTPVDWSQATPPPVGAWLISPGIDRRTTEMGVVSVPTRAIFPEFANSRAFLGVVLDVVAGELVIQSVSEDTGAARAGLQAADVILEANAVRIERRELFTDVLRPLTPGDDLHLKLRRGDEELEVTATLGRRPRTNVRRGQRNLNGDVNERSTDFPGALQHDTVIPPAQVGGPVFDIDGTFVGVNIARAGRIECYTLPSYLVEEAIEQALPEVLAANKNRVEQLRQEERYFREEIAELRFLVGLDEQIVDTMLQLQQLHSHQDEEQRVKVDALEVKLEQLIQRRVEFLENPKQRGILGIPKRERF